MGKILVTGTAGFIGHALCKKLLERGDEVLGLDNINDYYDVNLKFARLEDTGIARDKVEWNKLITSTKYENYTFVRLNLEDKVAMERLFDEFEPDAVCNLAAQAGVRYSIENPDSYISSNVVGFMNILECCRYYGVKNLSYASSSSVYGLNSTQPFNPEDATNHPISLYAATKKSNELMAHTYSHLYDIPTTGLRFFTVYGPWGRPDMAPYKFTKKLFDGEGIDVYNEGEMWRDFTYIDDIVEGVMRVIDHPATSDRYWDSRTPAASTSSAPYRIHNIGNGTPVKLMNFIRSLEKAAGKKFDITFKPIQPGDVLSTHANTESLDQAVGYKPNTPVEVGVKRFVEWYKGYGGLSTL